MLKEREVTAISGIPVLLLGLPLALAFAITLIVIGGKGLASPGGSIGFSLTALVIPHDPETLSRKTKT